MGRGKRRFSAANEVLEATAETIRKGEEHSISGANVQSENRDGAPCLCHIKWFLAEGHPLRPWLRKD